LKVKIEDATDPDDLMENEFKRKIKFTTEDSGIGISKANQKALFRLFGKLH
jgi:hypothetical protein